MAVTALTYLGIVVRSAPVIHLPCLHDNGGRQRPGRPPRTGQRFGCIEHVSNLIVFVFVCVKLLMESAIPPRAEYPVPEYL